MKKRILICVCIMIIIVFSLVKLKPLKQDENIDANTDKKNTTETEEPHYSYTFQDNHSLDWDFIDNGYLLKIAEYHGGSIEDRVYTIIVTLNKVFETEDSIQNVVLHELYDVDGLTSYQFEEIVASDITKVAMDMVLYSKFDNTDGSTEYIEFYLDLEEQK